MDFADYIRERRAELKLTQKGVALRAGGLFEDQYLSDWENRRGMPEPANLVALIGALELDPWRAWSLWIAEKVPGYELRGPALSPEEAAVEETVRAAKDALEGQPSAEGSRQTKKKDGPDRPSRAA